MRFTRAGLSLAALMLLAACDVPTGAPNWDTRWDVPAKSTTIAVSTLLPSGVTVTPDNSAFLVTVPQTSITRVLGTDCSACQAGNGTSMIKPAFTSSGSASATLPANVLSATTTKDTMVVTINNGYNFDPLRPSATARGMLIITATSGGNTVAADTVNGVATAMPPGQVLVRKIPVTGIVSGSGLAVSTSLTSPASDTAIVMNANSAVNFVASVNNFYVSSANVNVTNQPITAAAANLDLSNIDKSISDHALGGLLKLQVTNPFTVGGNLTMKFTTPSGVNLTRQITLAASSTGAVSSVSFTAAEVQSLFGQQVNLTINGSVSQTGASVTVQPSQFVSIVTRLVIDVNMGSK